MRTDTCQCACGFPDYGVPRLNIYVPADLAREIYGYRDEINLSEVCASALRAVISARETLRSADGLFDQSFPRGSSLEAEVARRFKLRRVVAGAAIGHSKNPYETVAHCRGGSTACSARIFSSGWVAARRCGP